MQVADVEMTGCWEKALAQIEGHTLDTETFMRSIRDYTHKATDEILRLEFPLPSHVPSLAPNASVVMSSSGGRRPNVTRKVAD